MTFGRYSRVMKNTKKVMPHDEFINRIRKTLYFGGDEEVEVSRPLAEYASDLFTEPHRGHSLQRLNSVAAGSIHATPCSLIMALIYLDRLNVSDPCYIRAITPQELFIVSMMVSTKFYAGHDEEIYLSDWAEEGDIEEERLKQLELEFLCAIDWNVYISNEEFFNKLTSIEKTIARREGLRRGWLTYTELAQMLPSFTLVKFLLNNITIMAVSYAASVITIAGAFFLASQIPGHALQRNKMQTTCDKIAGDGSTDTLLLDVDTMAQVNKDAKNVNGGITTIVTKLNDTSCAALNVEAELLRLEEKYREEARLEELSNHYKELTSTSLKHVTLPTGAVGVQESIEVQGRQTTIDIQHNWRALQEEYSDEICNVNKELEINTLSPYLTAMASGLKAATCYAKIENTQKSEFPINFTDCVSSWSNCTSFLFWNLFVDTAHQSLLRLPEMWLKFI